jgi:hypothetical protein
MQHLLIFPLLRAPDYQIVWREKVMKITKKTFQLSDPSAVYSTQSVEEEQCSVVSDAV